VKYFSKRLTTIHKGKVMLKKNRIVILVLVTIALLISGCGRNSNICDTEPPNLPVEVRQSLEAPQDSNPTASPIELEIRGRKVTADQVVHGFVCDDQWSGTVYVDCDVEVPEYQTVSDEEANFWVGCDLQIEEKTVVYVAFHNDEVYYKGCSCHTNE
jgi:hypothetical protein